MLHGHLYGLVTASLPGLVKVGYTVRNTLVRAAELSSSTGVPTPFMVAFDFPTPRVRQAESALHRIMEDRGWRVAPNREFFKCSVQDVIGIIEEFALIALPEGIFTEHLSAAALLASGDNQLLHDKTFEGACHALTFYRQAARLGSLQAFERAAQVYLVLDLTDPSHDRAFLQLKAGFEAGNYYCYAMTAVLLGHLGEKNSMLQAWSLFFSARAEQFVCSIEEDTLPGSECGIYNARFTKACRQYIGSCLRLGVVPKHLEQLRPNISSILSAQQRSLEVGGTDKMERDLLLRAIEWTYLSLGNHATKSIAQRGPSRWHLKWSVRTDEVAV